MAELTRHFTTCGWDGCTTRPDWDILAINSYGRPGRAHAPCARHLAPQLTEHYEAADLSQQDVWAWVVPHNPAFVDDYERDGEYGDEACHPDCGPIVAHEGHQHAHQNVDGRCWHANEEAAHA